MRLPSVPGPSDVLQLIERSAAVAEQLLAAVPRATALIGEAERLVGAAQDLVDRIELTRASAQGTVERTETVVTDADRLLQTLTPLTARLDGLTARLETLLARVEPSLTTLQPTLERLAETTAPGEVDALVELVDHLPQLAVSMQRDVLPVLGSLGSVAPDVHDLLNVSRELNEMLGQIPGISRMRRRVQEDEAPAR